MVPEPKLGCNNPNWVGVKFNPLPGIPPMTIGAPAVNGCRVKLPVPDTFSVQLIELLVRRIFLVIVAGLLKLILPLAVTFSVRLVLPVVVKLRMFVVLEKVLLPVVLMVRFPRGIILPIAPVNVTLPAPAFTVKLSVFAVVPSRVLLKARLPLLAVPDVVRVIVG